MTIEKITSDGIYYKNDSGQKGFCDFKKCNQNWISYRKRTERLNDEQIAMLEIKDKTIGQRDVEANNCFIELFTRPFTRFDFVLPEQMSEYQKLRDGIYKNGWTTHDLS